VIGLLIVCGARGAAADRPIYVDAAGAPFEAGELVAAIRVRVAAEGVPVRVRVRAVDHGVRVEVRGGIRDVELGSLQGPDAARLVALATDDLLLEDLATPPVPAATRPRPTIGVLGGVAGWDGGLDSLAVDLVLPRDGWLAAIDVGGAQPIGGRVDLTAGVIRASAGVRASWFEVRGGVTLVPVFVTTGAGDTTMLVGAGASARLRVPLTRDLRGVLAGGVDVFATRSEYILKGVPAFQTPWWAPWLAAGVEVKL
jgi:hypothetical protein